MPETNQKNHIRALDCFGHIIRVKPEIFLELIDQQGQPLVVEAEGGVLFTHYRYLMNKQGLTFFARSATKLQLPSNVCLIAANRIELPEGLELGD